ncbi:MAG: phosphoribosylpyrophosphate synthetase [Bacteroidetes bacterium]|nr:phosphoribosylpyrophosphate synthetase [Bacteroidota bacterium]
MNNYNTVTEALADLQARGYTIDFASKKNKVHLMNNLGSNMLSPEEFQIDETHRFEGATDPEDEMIVFAISSKKYKIKNYLNRRIIQRRFC